MKKTITYVSIFSIAIAASLCLGQTLQAEIVVQDKQTVAFMGDSITQAGADTPSGYVRLVVSGLATNDIEITPVPVGISGHKSDQMLERLERDVLSKNPDWLTLSCGVNDVWHGERGIPLEAYKKNITAIVDQAQAAGVKVAILTATMIHEDQTQPHNQTLVAYNDFLRELAKGKGCLLADLNAAMQKRVAADTEAAGGKAPGNFLTGDGVHMNPLGNEMMAITILETFGLNQSQIAKAVNAWDEIPQSSALDARAMISLKQYKQLSRIASERKMSIQRLASEILHAGLDEATSN